MTKRWVLVQSHFGIFIGIINGTWCWSRIETFGIMTAPTMDKDEGDGLINSLHCPPNLSLPYLVEVEVEGEEATVPELAAAGLKSMLGDMLITHDAPRTIQ